MNPLRICCLALLTTALAACGGSSGSSGPVTGLSVASQVSVLVPEDEADSSSIRGQSIESFPADADYFADDTFTFIYDAAMEPLETVNSILCQVAQAGYTDMVNEGTYIAQIDVGLCEQGNQGGDTGQSSGSQSPELEEWTLISTRSSNGASQFVNAWVPQGEEESGMPGDDESFIRVLMEISESASENNPFGSFAMDFAEVEEGGDVNDPRFFGTLGTFETLSGALGYNFFMEEGDLNAVPAVGERAITTQVSVVMSGDQTSGDARVRQRYRGNEGFGDTGIIDDEFLVSFNDQYMLRELPGGTQQKFDREDFDTQVWRYNLYYLTGEDAGERVDRVSGFNILDEEGNYGWIDYWGMWFPEDVTVEHGDTVAKEDFDDSTDDEEFTVLVAPGKLIKNTRETLDLNDIEGQTFYAYFFSPDGMAAPKDYLVEYTTGGQWVLTGEFNEGTGVWDVINPPTLINVGTIGWLDLWSDALGGNVNYVDGDPEISFWTQQFVDGTEDLFDNSDQVTLYGYYDCLKTGINQTDAENGNVYLADATMVGSPHAFVFDSTNMALTYDVGGGDFQNVALANGTEVTDGPYTWGMQSGPMVVDTSGFASPDDIWSATEFYTWETGPNPWNRLTALVDEDNEPVEFEPPLTFNYMHSTANDRNEDATYDGQIFLLNYNGPGNLWGFPHSGEDLDNDGFEDRWYPEVSLEDGVILEANNVQYVVKAIEMEQLLNEDPGANTGLDLSVAESLTLPDASDYQAPLIGDRPDIDAPPAVVGGVLQGSELNLEDALN